MLLCVFTLLPSHDAEEEAVSGVVVVVVVNELISLLETATVEGAATLECMMIVL